MTYTINGKKWTKADINQRCAELLGIEYKRSDNYVMVCDHAASIETGYEQEREYNPCTEWGDTGTIIEKCFDELTSTVWQDSHIYWDLLIDKHKCSKLEAACICYVTIGNTNE
jgi:hypothetical protein